jgi:hypothetical protein
MHYPTYIYILCKYWYFANYFFFGLSINSSAGPSRRRTDSVLCVGKFVNWFFRFYFAVSLCFAILPAPPPSVYDFFQKTSHIQGSKLTLAERMEETRKKCFIFGPFSLESNFVQPLKWEGEFPSLSAGGRRIKAWRLEPPWGDNYSYSMLILNINFT